MMTPHSSTCLALTSLTRDTLSLRLSRPDGFLYQAGQYVLFDVPTLADPHDLQVRAYSLASHPSEPDLTFAIRLKPGGRASEWLRQQVQVGTPITLKGPLGGFTLKPGPVPPLALVATGTGLAPMRGLLLEAIARSATSPIDLIVGMREAIDLFWLDELHTLEQQLPSLRVHLSLTRPAADWVGHHGRVQTLLPTLVPDLPTRHVYACGNPDMTLELKRLCLNTWGLTKAQMHVEGFI
jgi:ferredoxin-NADP reductase